LDLELREDFKPTPDLDLGLALDLTTYRFLACCSHFALSFLARFALHTFKALESFCATVNAFTTDTFTGAGKLPTPSNVKLAGVENTG
jgi:hypothetical protein